MDGTLPSRVATPTRRISVSALADGLAHEPLLTEDGRTVDPLLVVDLDLPTPSTTLDLAARAARACDRVLVGTATVELTDSRRELTEALDLTLVNDASFRGPQLAFSGDPPGDAEVLHHATTAHPQATLILAQLLRATGRLEVPAALDAESLAYSTLLGGAEFAAWLAHRGPRPPPPAAAEPVRLERDGGKLRITLNRPNRRNAYGRELRDALVDGLRIAVLDPMITLVVLDAAGPVFCSGGDLDEFGTTPDLAVAHFVRTRAGAAVLMHRLADRLEVQMHGSCVGAGIELPAFAGRVIAHPDTTFRLPETSMGLIPGAGGTVSIPRRIGRWRTLFLALSGRPLDARTALEWGLVDAIEPSETAGPANTTA